MPSLGSIIDKLSKFNLFFLSFKEQAFSHISLKLVENFLGYTVFRYTDRNKKKSFQNNVWQRLKIKKNRKKVKYKDLYLGEPPPLGEGQGPHIQTLSHLTQQPSSAPLHLWGQGKM